VKAVTEGSPDAVAPSYRFDAKEFGSNAPVLQVQMQTPIANVQFFYRFSTDNATWGPWTSAAAPDTTAPYTNVFSFPSGPGFYEFYSIATDSLGSVEAAPVAAQASVRFQAPVLQAQTITFAPLTTLQAGTTQPLSATASSGLTVTFSGQTPGTCTVSGSVVTASTAGICTVAADQAGNAGFAAATTVTQNFTVTSATTALSQTISFAPLPNKQLGTAPFVVTATATSGLSVSIVSQTLSVCTVSAGTVTLLAVGTCTLDAVQSGNATYAAAPTVSQSFSITSTTAVPIPLWALLMLGAGLLGAGLLRSRRPSI
jgi:hypothetical protein